MPDLSLMTEEQREAYRQFLRAKVEAANGATQTQLSGLEELGPERDAAQARFATQLADARGRDRNAALLNSGVAAGLMATGSNQAAMKFVDQANDRPFENSAVRDQKGFLEHLEQKAKLAAERSGLGVAQTGRMATEALQQLGNFERETQTRAAMAAENELRRQHDAALAAGRREDAAASRADANQRAREHNQLMQTIATQRTASSQDTKTEAQAAKAAAARDKDTEALSKRLEKSGFAQQAIAEVDKYLNNESADLPGYGRVGGLVPDLVASTDANALRASILNLSDALLRARTGANAPQSEVENVQRMYGIQRGAPEDVVRAGLKRLRNDTLAAMKQAEAGYSPEVVETFKKRGGVSSDSVAGKPPSGMVVVETDKGRRGAIPAENVEAFLKANKGSRVVSQ